MALRPYEGGRRDPFAEMDAMMGEMMMPFGRRGGAGAMGGHRSIFDQMDDMMRDPFGDRGGFGGGMQMMQGGGSSMMMTSSFGGGGAGFSSQTMMMTSTMGPDGKMHTEKYSSSSVGDHGRGAFEQQAAYSNTSTGMDKMSMERRLGEQGRKMVKERNRNSQEERSTEMFRGLEEDQAHEFDARWQREAAPYIPKHGLAEGGQARITNFVSDGQPGVQIRGPVGGGQPRMLANSQVSYGAPSTASYRTAEPTSFNTRGMTRPSSASYARGYPAGGRYR